MFVDPIVEEVRRIRRKIEDQYRDDPEGFLRHISEIQERYKDHLYFGKPKPSPRRPSDKESRRD